MTARYSILLLLAALFWTTAAQAHEARPGYLELNETARGQYDVLWKQPANGEYALRMAPVFPADCTLIGADNRKLLPGAMLTRFHLACPGGLDGRPGCRVGRAERDQHRSGIQTLRLWSRHLWLRLVWANPYDSID